MQEDAPPSKREMHWPTVLWYIYLHALGLWGLWLLIFEAKWLTVIFVAVITLTATLGITLGAHRLWAHSSYAASWPLRLFLMLAHTLAGAGNIYDWVLAHRIHHKFYKTNIDPYNHDKGFLYSHVFSNVMTSNPEMEKHVRDIDMRDVDLDGFVYLQRRFYWIIMPIFGLLLPINAPVEYWGESVMNSIFILGFLRFALTVNVSWLINSANLIWGLKPGQKYPPDENSIFLVRKSYWPHYHYMLPWDYKSGEFGTYDRGCSTTILVIWETLGIASGLKTATSEDIRNALARAAIGGVKMEDCLRDVRKSAEEEALKKQLAFKH
ncbi:acyl-CoA Delta-9 desaturase [Neodiprion virginianus]|uniref:acyl-CoA Delta-9 desaturase n=1 Tax=Neodiprion virginianus TaxID=2961670 RepID=UPI001EE73770|nr:acyl-CoA Delta-9 desaturase [Neodiprion virginianus]